MTTQHTPAPWNIRQHEKGYVVFYTDSEGNRSNTAQCHDHAVCEEHGTAEANARLIASAPELLAALLRLSEKTKIANALQHSGGEIQPEDWSELYALTNEAQAAIAKATAAAL